MWRILGAVVAGFVALLATLFVVIAIDDKASPSLVMAVCFAVATGVIALVLRGAKREATNTNEAPAMNVVQGQPHHDEVFNEVLDLLRHKAPAKIGAAALFTLSLLLFVGFAVLSGSKSVA